MYEVLSCQFSFMVIVCLGLSHTSSLWQCLLILFILVFSCVFVFCVCQIVFCGFSCCFFWFLLLLFCVWWFRFDSCLMFFFDFLFVVWFPNIFVLFFFSVFTFLFCFFVCLSGVCWRLLVVDLVHNELFFDSALSNMSRRLFHPPGGVFDVGWCFLFWIFVCVMYFLLFCVSLMLLCVCLFFVPLTEAFTGLE